MKLSLVVVNHNNGYLLKQTLKTFIGACSEVDYELIIIDNASTDQSLNVISQEFPEAKVIANSDNNGLAGANNKGLRAACGEYILLVRPDTISTTANINKILQFMDEHRNGGGLSLRVLNPEGRFLPESIHGLTPSWATFLKFIGFAKNLPKTRLYEKNHKAWVEEFRVSEIDILNDACMLIRRSILNKTGYFDEKFSMFGYNIDFSYRIRRAGYKNFYFPKAYLIKFDSKPSIKLSWKYIRSYYGAMVLFALKYLVRLPELRLSGGRELISSAYEVKG